MYERIFAKSKMWKMDYLIYIVKLIEILKNSFILIKDTMHLY